MKITGIIAAGGRGQRLGVDGGKQLLEINGRPVVVWAIDALATARLVENIVVVCDPARVEEYAQHISATVQTDKPLTFASGGNFREDSVYAGLVAAADADIVVIHDGARPLLEAQYADAAIQQLIDDSDTDGVVLASPAVDTIKRVENYYVTDTPQRRHYWHAQTPQVFWRDQLMKVYEAAKADGYRGTDDASYFERKGGNITVVPGSRTNIKITTAEDVQFVQAIFALRGGSLSNTAAEDIQ
ncbi:MAG: 2-C-methyl-D-erythritol 4-phosphate cytidylyltransferase [Coriobacteriia bacterium]|nr:2-C-methyl-D-erythritol 4-phosphate cytidylyltransferase [Coriobacteriia bacterium]